MEQVTKSMYIQTHNMYPYLIYINIPYIIMYINICITPNNIHIIVCMCVCIIYKIYNIIYKV